MDARAHLLLRPNFLRQRIHRRSRQMDAQTLDTHHVLQFEFGRSRRRRFPHRRTGTRIEQVVLLFYYLQLSERRVGHCVHR